LGLKHICVSAPKELIVKTSNNSNLAYKIIVNQSFLIFFLLFIISLSKSSDCEFIYSLSLCLLGDNVKPKNLRSWLASLRSEEHTSELQSRFDLVCRLLLEKKQP